MPSGAHVTARVIMLPGFGVVLNVIVYPLKEDYAQSSGLCGNYNGNPNDDLTPAGSTIVDTGKDPLIFPPSFM